MSQQFCECRKGRRVKMGSVTAFREGRAQHRAMINWVSALGQNRGEFVIFRDSVGGQEERTPQIAVLMVISIGCACTWDLAEEP